MKIQIQRTNDTDRSADFSVLCDGQRTVLRLLKDDGTLVALEAWEGPAPALARIVREIRVAMLQRAAERVHIITA